MDVHLDPDAAAPVVAYPDAGVILVHYCSDDAARLGCGLCPEVTPERAGVLAIHALEAAGVAYDAHQVQGAVTRALGEQLAWRQTVLSLAAGELVAEPTRELATVGGAAPPGLLDHAVPAWLDQPTDATPLPLVEQTAPIPRGAHPRARAAGAGGREPPRRLVPDVLALAAIGAMIAVATAVAIGTRPAWPPSWPGSGQQRPGLADVPVPAEPNAPAGRVGEPGQRPAGGAGAGEQTAPRPGETTTNPPTPTPAPEPTSSPSGDAGGRTSVDPPPVPTPPAGTSPAPAPEPSTSSPAPEPTRQPTVPAPEPEPSTAEPTTPATEEAGEEPGADAP